MPVRQYLGYGRTVDLTGMCFELDWDLEVAQPLGKIARYGGQPVGDPYSVAEHQDIGSRAILSETGNARAAFGFHIHDVHEVIGGDATKPFADLVDFAGRSALGIVGVSKVIDHVKDALDVVIFHEAGLPELLPAESRIVTEMDRRMAAYECEVLYPVSEIHPDNIGLRRPIINGEVPPIRRLPWREAASAWLSTFNVLRERVV